MSMGQDKEKNIDTNPIAMGKYAKQFESLDKVAAAFTNPIAIGKYAKQFENLDKVAEKLIKVDSFSNAVSALSNPVCFNAAVESIATFEDYEGLSLTDINKSIDENESQFRKIESDKSFIDIFTNLPVYIRTLIIVIFIYIFLPQVNSITANLLTPHVENFLSNNPHYTKREKISAIKKLPTIIPVAHTEGLRFITGNNVRLRRGPSTRTVILDELVLGQIVAVISKKKNWIEVEYQYDNGELMQGWVFSKYASKFK